MTYKEPILPLQVYDTPAIFDDQFSIATFQEVIDKDKKQTNTILTSVRKAVLEAANSDGDAEDYQYLLDVDSKTKASLESGVIKLATNADGDMIAQIRKENGQYGKRIPVKKELVNQGLPVGTVEMALQMEAIQEQLEKIMDALQVIEGRVIEVLQGQQNDRLGLFYSGLSLFIESRSVADSFLQKQLVAQALKTLSDANSQMIQEIRTNVEFLVGEQYRGSKKVEDIIDERLSMIHQCYGIVYKASFLKAAIYYDSGEIPAMLTAIDEYGKFVEKLIIPYAGKLSEFDKYNQFIEKGTWGTISKTLVECNKLKKQITMNHTYYLSN